MHAIVKCVLIICAAPLVSSITCDLQTSVNGELIMGSIIVTRACTAKKFCMLKIYQNRMFLNVF